MAYTEKYIASSVFVNHPTGTILNFSNGVSFTGLVREASVVHSVTRTITVAELLSLNSSPVQLLAPVANAAYEPLAFSWKIDFNSVAYDVTSITAINLKVGSEIFFSDTSLNPLTSVITTAYSFARFTGDAVELSLNKEVTVSCDGADPTLGNSTVTVELLYKINTFA
jgi:hypothetical protein